MQSHKLLSMSTKQLSGKQNPAGGLNKGLPSKSSGSIAPATEEKKRQGPMGASKLGGAQLTQV